MIGIVHRELKPQLDARRTDHVSSPFSGVMVGGLGRPQAESRQPARSTAEETPLRSMRGVLSRASLCWARPKPETPRPHRPIHPTGGVE